MKRILFAAFLILVPLSAAAQERQNIGPVPKSAYSAAVKVTGGTYVFLGGIEPVDEKGNLVAPGDFEGQVRQVWKNLEHAMKLAGGTSEDVVTMTVFTTERRWNTIFTGMRRDYFKQGFPSSAFVEARKLKTPGSLLTIRAIAMVKD
jgi:2-iminobutanoate/2-iminopropanoate deaminase